MDAILPEGDREAEGEVAWAANSLLKAVIEVKSLDIFGVRRRVSNGVLGSSTSFSTRGRRRLAEATEADDERPGSSIRGEADLDTHGGRGAGIACGRADDGKDEAPDAS
jgi:hypothetical protein